MKKKELPGTDYEKNPLQTSSVLKKYFANDTARQKCPVLNNYKNVLSAGRCEEHYVPNFANMDYRTENVFCFRKTCFDFVQEITWKSALPNPQKYDKIILKGKHASNAHLKASNFLVIAFKPKMFDGLVLLSYFNGICCNQADLCPALFRHSHF